MWHTNRTSSSDCVVEELLVSQSPSPSSIPVGTSEPPSRTNSIEIQAANLQKLAMVWGFTKYTHLAFLTGERCWDEELLDLIPIVRFANPDDVSGILYSWYVQLGDDGFDENESVFLWVPVSFDQPKLDIMCYADFSEMIEGEEWLSPISSRPGIDYTSIGLRVDKNRLAAIDEDDEIFGWLHTLATIDENYFKSLIDISWLTDESFLCNSLVAVFSRFNETPVLDRAKAPVIFDSLGASNFINQQLHVDMDFGDVEFRLLGLFRLWNAMKYFSPYINIVDGNWNEILLEHIPRMVDATDRLSYELTLMSLASNLHDAHVFFVSPLGDNRFARFDHIFGKYVAPVRITEAEGRLVVIEQISIPVSGHSHELILMPGDVVLGVNDIDINEFVDVMMQYVSYPNREKALFYLNFYMILRQHSSDEPMALNILRDGTSLMVEIQTVERQQHMQHFIAPQPITAYVRLHNNIGLINPSRVQGEGEEESIHYIMKYFADTDGLIVDLRQRPTGAMPPFHFALADYIVDVHQLFGRITVPSQSIPGVFADMIRVYAGGLSGECRYAYSYENNVVLLMDEQTMSFPEWTIMALRNSANVTVIGSNSMGANGDVRVLPLPGGITMNFSNVGVFTPEGGQTQRIGLSPDIYVPRTVEGIRDGRDELMEAAIQFLVEHIP